MGMKMDMEVVDTMSFDEYLNTFATLLQTREKADCVLATTLMSVRSQHIEQQRFQVEHPPAGRLRDAIQSPFDALLALHLRVNWYLSKGRFEDAFAVQAQLVQTFVREILQKRKDENWFLPLCYRICSDLRLCAKTADLYPYRIRLTEETSTYYEQAAGPIMDCYRSCIADARGEIATSKRLSILNLTNQLFRIYFKINKLNLLKPLIRAIENCGPLYDTFSLADKVTYKYYLGRKAMFDSDLSKAEDALMYAFDNCPASSRKNKRLILMYLIPVKMFLGHLPTRRLLERFDLLQFYEIANGIREGNVMRLETALNEHEHFFIGCGIFLLLEKLKVITYRTLFKKVCAILKTHQIPLQAFLVALEVMQVDDIDLDEVACILANLIYSGSIKGYISHQHSKLVISKKDSFPSLSSLTKLT